MLNAPLLTRLQNHVAAMAPEQKERRAGRLIIDAAQHIAQLERELNAANAKLDEARKLIADTSENGAMFP